MIIYVMKNGTLDSHYVSGVTSDGTVTLSDAIDAVEVWIHLPEEEREKAREVYRMKVLTDTKETLVRQRIARGEVC